MWRVDTDGIFRYHDPFEEELLAMEDPSKCWNFDPPDPHDPMGVRQAMNRYYPEMQITGMLFGAAFALIGAAIAGIIGAISVVANIIRDYRARKKERAI